MPRRRGRSEAGVRLVVDDVVEVKHGIVVGAARREVVVGRLGGRDHIEVVGRVVAREPVRREVCGLMPSLTARDIVDEHVHPGRALAGRVRVDGVDHPVGARLVADVRPVLARVAVRRDRKAPRPVAVLLRPVAEAAF